MAMADYRISWIVIAVILVVVQLAIGTLCGKGWLGILVDSRNRFSLSRLQMVLWTTVLVSAFFSILFHLKTTSIYIPPEVWALMGISTGSAVGSIMIKDNKSLKQPTAEVIRKLAETAPSGPAATAVVAHKGVLAVARNPRFSDLFLGEELTDSGNVDIGKVQMFFFTMVAVIGYATALDGCALDVKPTDLNETYSAYFPALSASLLTLIGISHVGYLTVKASPKTPTTS